MYDFLSFYVHLLVTVITCKLCMFKFGIVVACDIENILHFKKINEEWLLYKWYKGMIIYFMHFTMYIMAYVCIL